MDKGLKPSDISGDDLCLIARHLGYEAIADTCGGYNVERVILDRPYAGQMLFNPYRFHEQALHLMVHLVATIRLPLDEEITPYMSAEAFVDKVVRKAIGHFQAVDQWKRIETNMRTKKETKP